MKTRTIRTALVAMLAAGLTHAGVENPWVTTDRTVDCSSYETVIRDVCGTCTNDEQKAIALYNFYRQRVYHYLNTPESRDPLKCVNVIGNTLCGSQGTCMKGFLAAAGIKARVVSGPGHTFYEAYYDGKGHGFDTFMNFYVFTRGTNRNVASFDEIKKDPTLVTKAVEEGRAVPGFLPCGDTPECFMAGVSENNYDPMKLNWSVKALTLRPGEEIVRSWWPEGKALPGTAGKKDKTPYHGCGSQDKKAEPYLFKFWEPYGIPKYERKSVSYRHYFNGRLNYAPDLTSDRYKEGVVSEKGLKASASGLAGEGEVVFGIKCPFYISGSDVAVEAVTPGDGDAVELAVSADGKKWTPATLTKDATSNVSTGSLDSAVVKGPVGLHSYQVRVALKGKATLKHFYLSTVFTHNAMSAPHLMPGKNNVTVAVANDAALKESPLTVVYRYREAPAEATKLLDMTGWTGEIKTVSKQVDKSPFTFEVALPETAKLPQMQDLTLRCGELAWRPGAAK
jgi:hypothetical protein